MLVFCVADSLPSCVSGSKFWEVFWELWSQCHHLCSIISIYLTCVRSAAVLCFRCWPSYSNFSMLMESCNTCTSWVPWIVYNYFFWSLSWSLPLCDVPECFGSPNFHFSVETGRWAFISPFLSCTSCNCDHFLSLIAARKKGMKSRCMPHILNSHSLLKYN